MQDEKTIRVESEEFIFVDDVRSVGHGRLGMELSDDDNRWSPRIDAAGLNSMG